MLKNYFRLFEECYLVQGTNRGSIYNLLNGYIYDLSNQEQMLLNLLETNQSIDEIINVHNIERSFIEKTLSMIKEQDLGNYFDKPVYIEKTIKYPQWQEFLFTKAPPVLIKAFINLENKCDKMCSYCNYENVRTYYCLSCHKDNDTSKGMNRKDIFKILQYLKRLNCYELYFTGGNIFLNYDRTIEILKYARNLGFKSINVIYGGNNLDARIIDGIEDLDICIIIQIYIDDKNRLYSHNILNQLEKYKNKLSNKILILLDNISLDEEDFKFIYRKISPVNIYVDQLYNKEIGGDYFQNINQLGLTSIEEFSFKKRYNLCLNGTLYISYDGKISPCPGLREFIVGDINDFYSIFSEDGLYKYWNLNKDKIHKCSQCSHKYACNDCRAIEYKLTKDLYGLATCNDKY